jgi:hypothetical protein
MAASGRGRRRAAARPRLPVSPAAVHPLVDGGVDAARRVDDGGPPGPTRTPGSAGWPTASRSSWGSWARWRSSSRRTRTGSARDCAGRRASSSSPWRSIWWRHRSSSASRSASAASRCRPRVTTSCRTSRRRTSGCTRTRSAVADTAWHDLSQRARTREERTISIRRNSRALCVSAPSARDLRGEGYSKLLNRYRYSRYFDRSSRHRASAAPHDEAIVAGSSPLRTRASVSREPNRRPAASS